MKNFQYEITGFNPKEKSVEQNDEFTESCKSLFNAGGDFKYLTLTGIKYTDEHYAFWRESFEPDKKEYLIAKDNSKIIGLCIIHKDPFDKYDIIGLAVDVDYRRQGIAANLIKAAEQNAKKRI